MQTAAELFPLKLGISDLKFYAAIRPHLRLLQNGNFFSVIRLSMLLGYILKNYDFS